MIWVGSVMWVFMARRSRRRTLTSWRRAGAKLEEFYAQPMCTPTRASLMTGRYPLRYGLQTLVIPSSYTYGLATNEWLRCRRR